MNTAALIAQFREIYSTLVTTLVAAIPQVLTGIVVLLAMLIVAKLVEKILRAFLVRLRFDSLLEQSGVDKTLHRIGLRQSLNQALPRLVYFLLLFLFARTAADVLGLTAISEAIAALFGYLPNVVAAVLLLLVGSAASQFAGQTVHQAAVESGIDFAASLGSLVSAIILFIVGIMALTQLKVDTEMVRLVSTCALAGAGLAFGLSFGLGSREVTRNILSGFYARRLFRAGETIEVGGRRGVVRAVTPTQTLVEDGAALLAIANVDLLNEVVRVEPSAEDEPEAVE